MKIREQLSDHRNQHYRRVVAIGITSALALTACSSRPEPPHKPSISKITPAKPCDMLLAKVSSTLGQQLIDHTAPHTFTDQLADPDLRIIDFGLPVNATTTELEFDQKVINAMHDYTDKHHVIRVEQGKTNAIPLGKIGVALYIGDCTKPTPQPNATA